MIKELNGIKLKETYAVPSSKSIAHRALICAAFSTGGTRIRCVNFGEDVRRTAEALIMLGAQIIETADGFLVIPIDRYELRNKTGVIDCKDSGTTYRFMSEILKEFDLTDKIKLTGSDRLLERVDRSVPTSQYISGELLALGTRGTSIEIEGADNIPSVSYVELTIDVMNSFGGTGYVSPKKYFVEGDWSSAAVFMVAGAIAGETQVEGVTLTSAQGDSSIIEILRAFGACVTAVEDRVMVKKGNLRGISLDGSYSPDLVPLLAVLGAFSEGETRIGNIGYLKFKESDRLKSTADMINSLGGKCEYTENELIITGTGGLKPGKVNAYNDHRIAMAAACAAFGIDGTVEIDGAESVEKSYPGFWEEIDG